MMMWYVDGA